MPGGVEAIGRAAVVTHRDGAVHVGAQRGEAGLRRAQVVELGQRHRPIVDAIVEGRNEQHAFDVVDRDAAKLVCVNEREEQVVHAEADAKHDDRGQCEPAIAQQDANGETDVLDQHLEHGYSTLFTVRHSHAIDATELLAGGQPRVGVGHAGTLQVLDEQVEVMRNLVRQAIFS
jgi:hypothetical protein